MRWSEPKARALTKWPARTVETTYWGWISESMALEMLWTFVNEHFHLICEHLVKAWLKVSGSTQLMVKRLPSLALRWLGLALLKFQWLRHVPVDIVWRCGSTRSCRLLRVESLCSWDVWETTPPAVLRYLQRSFCCLALISQCVWCLCKQLARLMLKVTAHADHNFKGWQTFQYDGDFDDDDDDDDDDEYY